MTQSSRRIGVVDVGSNSVRLVVFDAMTRSPAYFFNEKVLCGLGADLHATGRLSVEGRARAMAAIRRFVLLARLMGVRALDGIATAAVREAADGAAFRDEVERETGLRLRIASGEDEARLAAQGVLLGWPGADGVVADLGGASLELARVGEGRVGMGRTFPLGPLRLAGVQGGAAALDAVIDHALADARAILDPAPERLFLVGGAWRALAKIHMTRERYPLQVLHEFELPAEVMLATAERVAEEDPKALARQISASAARLAVTPLGARVLARLIRAAAPRRVAVSAFGLREGVLYEHLDPAQRAEDPLLSAARDMERRQARFPGFGDELDAWVRPLFPDASPAMSRLITAVCLLSDVAWNSHPDYRDLACLETVYRANISGVTHAERAFMGAALGYRYKSARSRRQATPAAELLTAEQLAQARVLGRGVRLGAMLAASAPGVLPRVALERADKALRLRLPEDLADLAGEVVRKRLAAVAQSLKLAPEIAIGAAQAQPAEG
ncbi:Ppx/GppA family phosphatase [Oceanicella actignis]|uniref:Exopolyphosphatase / guanosine-5'-triphosphate,3'-diphosphate pyrophosphatase n=1 Tax=Oceanicella actignis TaxID=1189325 RepID=A0A1M7S142_9RHOB|nr:Ppx/GppA family phosphatase [Oceanicella actignis]TYO90105.1 exopolyphosphatase/guanosine-5'-triphosphate,3'-diphosphate pyrophosphatase [Oceanicella actignis]SES93017.1 exopolyphosphatase / guanosine-5'-triphosphate,3'-diphosphate pyrophosphatase [Oceanicella actignis]SHN52064.1 exopolyphosphatase / guanosine-5'-triphosphate,3'-diphosphate pyrophosphatase [Oceanicella actignis]